MAIGRRNIKNNWATALDFAAAAADTTLWLPQPWIDKLTAPTPSASEWYELTLDDGVQAPEIVRCTGKGTGTVTVVRAQQGTVAVAWGAGAKVEIRVTAGLLRVIEASDWYPSQQVLAIGPNSGVSITTGSGNTLMGQWAGNALTSGSSNTAFGDSALYQETTGSSNTAVGYAALGVYSGSANNVAMGRSAAANPGIVNRTIYIGAFADAGTLHQSDVVCIGHGATAYTANTAVLGSQSSRLADVYIGGGQRDNAAAQVTLQASAGSGTNKTGGDLRLAGGKGTGTGAGGKVIIATAAAGASGSAENALTNRAEWDTAGLFFTYGGLKTGNPGLGAGTWKLGTVQAGTVALDTANYVEVDIGGTVVKLLKAA